MCKITKTGLPPQGFNRGNNFNPEQSYQAPTQQNQIIPLNELEKVKRMNEANMKAMQTQIDIVKNELRNEMKNLIQASLSNHTNEIKNMMASLFQMNFVSTSGSGSLPSNTVANPKGKLKAITTRSGLVLDGPTVPTPRPFINPEEDKRVEETLTEPDLSEYTIKVPPPPDAQTKQQEKDEVQIHKFWQMFKQLHINITLTNALILMPKYQKMLKALLFNKEKLQELANTPLNEICSAVIRNKLPEKLGDPEKFIILCGFSELKCKALANLGASINLMPLSVWKKLGLPELSTRMTLELANRAICTPAGIARDVFVPVGKFTFLADFVIVDYKSDPRVPLILGRPFLRTTRALIDVHGEEMILRDRDERLTLNMRHDTSSYSNQPQKESINLINVFNNSSVSHVFIKVMYAKSRPNGKLIHNSIINGPYVRRMIPEPGDTNREVPVNETFHVQIDDVLTQNELKQIEADDQAIQTILLGLPEDIYAAIDSCETAQEIWLRVQQMMKGSDIGIQEKKAKLFNEWERFTSMMGNRLPKEVDELKAERLEKTQDPLELMANSNNPYAFLAPHQDQPSFNQNYMQQPIPNHEDITDPTTAMNMALALMAKAFKLNYSTPTNNNQRISSNPRNRNLNGYNAVQNVGNQVIQNAAQNLRVQNIGNQNGLIGVPGNVNQNLNGNGNLVAARAKGNAARHNGNQIRCYNCRGVVAYLDEIEEVNANCILMANLQQASTLGTQTDKAPVYDSDRSAEYTELLEPIPKSHQVPQNDNNVIYEVTSVEQSEGTVEQNPVNVEETHALYDSLYKNLAIEVKKVNTVNQETLKLAHESRQKMKQLNKEIKPANYTKINHLSMVFVSQTDKSREELYFLHASKTANVSKSISIPNEEFSDDTTPSVARNFLNEEAAKFVGDFKSIAKESDESLAKHKVMELEIERLLRVVVSQDIMSVVQNNSVVDTSNLQTELEHTLNPLSQKLENDNVELEFQVSVQKDNIRGTSTNTEFAKQSILGKPPTLGETYAFSKLVTLNSIPTPQESKVVKNDKVITPGMFRINPVKPSREEKHVPNNVRASVRTKPITVSQPPVITKKVVNSDSNGFSSI
nr:hypothetical protein [Tanacetum cinerariifolium]